MPSDLLMTPVRTTLWTVAATQAGYAAIRMAPVALNSHSVGAVALGGFASGVFQNWRDGAESRNEARARRDLDPSARNLNQLMRTVQRFERDTNIPRLMIRTGFEAAIGAAFLLLAHVTGVIHVGIAFAAGALGVPLLLIGVGAVSAFAHWIYQPVLH